MIYCLPLGVIGFLIVDNLLLGGLFHAHIIAAEFSAAVVAAAEGGRGFGGGSGGGGGSSRSW